MSLTTVLYALGFIVLGGVVFLLAALLFGRGEDLPPLPAEGTPTELPDLRPILSSDARSVRLPVSVRGYRMADTDWVIEKLAEALEDRDHEIARLRSDLSDHGERTSFLYGDPEPPAASLAPPAGERDEPGAADPSAGATARAWRPAPPGRADRRTRHLDDPPVDD